MPPINPVSVVITSVNNLPSPSAVFKGALALVHTAPISEVIHPRHKVGFLILVGDDDGNTEPDVTVVPLRVENGEMRAMPGAEIGPENVPIQKALGFIGDVGNLLPSPFGGGLKMMAGALIGLTGMVERLIAKLG